MEVLIMRRPGFVVMGKKTWISGQDNELFGRFWKDCQEQGFLKRLDKIRNHAKIDTDASSRRFLPAGALLGLSRIENNPSQRAFYYMIAVEVPRSAADSTTFTLPENCGETNRQADGDMEYYDVPAGLWAVFPCHGPVPESIMNSEIYAFTEWLPTSPYIHAGTVEMELYPDNGDGTYCEFWLQVKPRENA